MGWGTSSWGAGAGGGSGDINPPVFSDLSPANGATLNRDGSVTFRVSDLVPGVTQVIGWMKYEHDRAKTVIYDGDEFSWPFDELSSVDDVNGNGTVLDFTVRPAGGWRGVVELMRFRAMDGAGNLDVE